MRQIGTKLSLNFVDGNQPFTTDITYGTPYTQETSFVLSCNGKNYDFSFGAATTNGYTFVKAAEGKTCGLMTYKGDWMKLPGVEGMKLKTVELYMSNMGSGANKGFGLRDTADGANLASQYVLANSTWCILSLNNSVAGQRYYVAALNNTGYYSKVNLIYEK